MGTVNDKVVRRRVIAMLFANRLTPYTDTVPESGSGVNARYPRTQEFTDSILEVDALICQARASTPGDPYRSQWMDVTGPLVSGTIIPAHIGAKGNIEIDNGDGWIPARLANSREEMIEIINNPSLYSSLRAFIEDNEILHNAKRARVRYPNFEKTDVCQAPDVDELAVVMGTLGSMPKDGAVSPEIYSVGAQYLQAYIAMIKGEQVMLPEVAQFERAQ